MRERRERETSFVCETISEEENLFVAYTAPPSLGAKGGGGSSRALPAALLAQAGGCLAKASSGTAAHRGRKAGERALTGAHRLQLLRNQLSPELCCAASSTALVPTAAFAQPVPPSELSEDNFQPRGANFLQHTRTIARDRICLSCLAATLGVFPG